MTSRFPEPVPRLDTLKTWVNGVLAEDIETWIAMPAAASARKFYRVSTPRRTMVAMDAPPPENNTEFVRLARLFKSAGVAVPDIIDVNLEDGFLLVSDLGKRHLADVYGGREQDTALEAALSTLVNIQSIPTPDLPLYDTALCTRELDIFKDWLLGELLELGPPPMLDRVFAALTDNASSQPRVPMHRDYHSKNLLWGDDGTLRVVDFQGALIGPAAYDLCSLLRDCYWRFPEADIQRWRNRYLELARVAGIGDWRPASFARWLDWMALQRQLKALGIFVRLKLKDHRSTHIKDIAPVLQHVVDIAHQYDELHEFGRWLIDVVQPAVTAHPALQP